MITSTKTTEYLINNNIYSIEELVGKTIYIVYASQGIKSFTIRKVEYTQKNNEWYFVILSSYPVSMLGIEIFFSEEEAQEYRLRNIEKYTQAQQEKILRQKRETEERELRELDRLLAKYPDRKNKINI